MYWYLGKFIKFITLLFRIIQVLAIIYAIIFFFYWFCAVANFKIAYSMAPYYEIPCGFINGLGINFDSNFGLLKPDIFLSAVFTIIVLVIYNFIFIPLGAVEKFFVEKSYDKGEKEYK